MSRTTPLVFDVARGSCVDGPGIRTTVFFKGCPLRCLWCHNPEGRDFRQEIQVRSDRCNECGACRERCPTRAIDLETDGIIDRSRCSPCEKCAEVCDALAIRMVGVARTVEELVAIALADRVYFEVSGGGVTLSGGEPLAHLDFVGALVRRLKQEGIHVAVQTCGEFDFSRFEWDVLPWVDHILYDIKLVDPATHAKLTGRGNERILENLKRLVQSDRIDVVPRVPLVPGLTATSPNLAAIAQLFRALGIRSYELLPYNPSGLGKWPQLGKRAPAELPVAPLTLEQERELSEQFAAWMGSPEPATRADA